MTDDVQGGDVVVDPQHDGGDIPDRGPRASGISGNDNDATEYPSFLLIVDQAAE